MYSIIYFYFSINTLHSILCPDTILGLPGSSQQEGHKDLVYWTEKFVRINIYTLNI